MVIPTTSDDKCILYVNEKFGVNNSLHEQLTFSLCLRLEIGKIVLSVHTYGINVVFADAGLIF